MNNPQTPDTGSIPLEGNAETLENIIGTVKERFKELKHKKWDWTSFYHGWIEGRSNMWANKQPHSPAKSLDECKLDLCKGGTPEMRDIVSQLNGSSLEKYYDSVAELYASQFKSQHNTGWVKPQEVANAVRAFAEYLDEGFHQDEPFAVKYVDDFIYSRSTKKKATCSHNWQFKGEGEYYCNKCGEWK